MRIAATVLQVLLALAFLGAGGSKLYKAEQLIPEFQEFGLPFAAIYIIGGLEIAGAIGLWIRPLRKLAALGLACLMLGAIGSHIKAAHALGQSVPSAVLLVLLVSLLLLWRKAD